MQRIYSLSVVRSRVVNEFSMISPALVGMCPPRWKWRGISVSRMFGRSKIAASDVVRSALMRTRRAGFCARFKRDCCLLGPAAVGRPVQDWQHPRAPPKPRAENMFSKYRRCSRPETTACHRMSGIAYAVCSKGRRCSSSVRSCVKGCWHGLIMRVARS